MSVPSSKVKLSVTIAPRRLTFSPRLSCCQASIRAYVLMFVQFWILRPYSLFCCRLYSGRESVFCQTVWVCCSYCLVLYVHIYSVQIFRTVDFVQPVMPPYLASLWLEPQFNHLNCSKPASRQVESSNIPGGLRLCQFCKRILSHDFLLPTAERNTPNTIMQCLPTKWTFFLKNQDFNSILFVFYIFPTSYV